MTRVVVKMTECDENAHDVEEFVRHWSDLVDGVKVQPLIEFGKHKRTEPCLEPFDKHLVVLVDGTVVPCCADYGGKLALGHAGFSTLDQIWNDEPAQMLRQAHDSGEFPGPCGTCVERAGYGRPRFRLMSS